MPSLRDNAAAMIYKFKSKAGGDIIMLQPHGDQLLRLLGREPAAPGIIEPGAMPAAIAALESALAGAEAAASADGVEDGGEREPPVSLRRRLWPMIELLRRADQAQVPVVWGV